MIFRPSCLLLCICAGLLSVPAASAQQADKDLTARVRVFTEVGPGIRAISKDRNGRYYILTAPGPAVLLYDPAGRRIGQIPGATTGSPSAKQAALVFGDDMDVDAAGRVYVADRGGNAVKVYGPDGSLLFSVPVVSPSSVVAVGADEFAVAGMKMSRLVTVYNFKGKVVREFGDPSEAAERQDLKQYLNIGRLATDPAGDIYYAFSYLPEPTVRKYDPYGYAAYEAVQETLDFYPVAQAARREIWKQDAGGKAPVLKPTVTALAVDPATQELWMAVGGTLLHFDKDGNRRGSYRTYTPEGARIESVAILVEPNRLLLAADPLGIYEFARPDKIVP
jgi:hypothetical protein